MLPTSSKTTPQPLARAQSPVGELGVLPGSVRNLLHQHFTVHYRQNPPKGKDVWPCARPVFQRLVLTSATPQWELSLPPGRQGPGWPRGAASCPSAPGDTSHPSEGTRQRVNTAPSSSVICFLQSYSPKPQITEGLSNSCQAQLQICFCSICI